MARAEFVHKRAESSNLLYARPVPPDLRDHPDSQWHGKQWAQRKSLGTSDVRKANEAARRLSVDWDQRFQAERDRLHPQTLEIVTPEMAAELARRVRVRILRDDDKVRFDPDALMTFLKVFEWLAPPIRYLGGDYTSSYLLPQPDRPGHLGIRPDQFQRLVHIHRLMGRLGTTGTATGDPFLGRVYAEAEMRELGFRVNWDKPENRPALIAILRAAVSAWIDRGRRDSGDVVETPELPAVSIVAKATTPAKQPSGHSIADALELWVKERTRSQKTLGVFTRHAEMFKELMGNPALESLTLPDGLAFKDKVQEWAIREKRTSDTANNVLSSVRAMLRLAQQRGWVPTDPLAGVSVKVGGAESSPRLPWTEDDLVRLFDAPLFNAYELPKMKAAGLDAAYWVPLMLAYSGARPGEIAQLWTDDIFEAPGGLAIEFRENTERGQRLKKKPGQRLSPSWRVTPVHERLISLGFREYWAAIAARGTGPLFPELRRGGQNGYAAGVGKWFGLFKKAQGFADEGKDLHSFRHTVRTELGLAGVSSDITKAIQGHAAGDVHSGNYGATMRRRVEDLRPYLNKLHYPALDLARVYMKT